MKRLTRRQFLKATGAAAGMAVLGQACAPLTQTPSGLDTLLADANIEIDGNKVVIPICCSYTGEYYVDNPPKRPIYGIWARNFEPVITLLEDPSTFPTTDPGLIQALKNCLGFAVDMLFQGDTHSARNALAVVAYMLVHIYDIKAWLKVSKELAEKEDKGWLTVNYSNPANQTDLWDMLSFTPAEATKPEASQPAGSSAIRGFLGSKGGDYPQLSTWLDRLVTLADAMNLWTVFGEELKNDEITYNNVWNNYLTLMKDCPLENCTETAVSDATKDQLSQMGIHPDPPSFGNALGGLVTKCSETKGYVNTSLASFDALATEEGMQELERYIGAMKDVVLEFARRVDEAKKEAEEYANARDNIGHENKHVWDVIPTCLAAATVGEFNKSLHAWWGAKKYIMAAISAIVNIPIIIATAGIAILGAIAIFAMDFIELMIGGTLDVLKNFGECLIKETLNPA